MIDDANMLDEVKKFGPDDDKGGTGGTDEPKK